MSQVQNIIISLFAIDSLPGVAFRAFIWFIIAILIMVISSKPNFNKTRKNLKSNLGFLFIFIALATTLIYMLFGFTIN